MQNPMPMPQGDAGALASTNGVQPTPVGQQDQHAEADPNVTPEEQAEYDLFVKKAYEIVHQGKSNAVMPEILQSLSAGNSNAPAASAPPTPAPNAPPVDPNAPPMSPDPNAPPMDPNANPSAPPPPGQPDPTDQPQPGEAPDTSQHPNNGPILALANTTVQVVQKLDVASHEAGKPWSDDVLYHGSTEVVGMLAEIAQHAGIHDYSEEEIQGAFFQAVDLYRPIAIEMGRTSDQTLKGQFGEIVDADKAGRLGDVLPGAGPQTVGEAPVQAAPPQK